MKTIEQLIKSFQAKAAMDDFSIVSKDDLLAAVMYLETTAGDAENKISLNANRVPSELK